MTGSADTLRGRAATGGPEGRRGLIVSRPPDLPYTRGDLVALVRAGIRGIRLTGRTHLTSSAPEAATRHLCFLRDAAGVGLRVVWHGSVEGLPVDPLAHLDPPRVPDAAPVWPVPTRPLLTMRHGPGYVLVEDRRAPDGISRTLYDGNEARLLMDPAMARVVEADLTRAELAAVGILAERGLFLKIGQIWCALPVRFRYARA
ncbi:DUF5825 family protein [Micromonospora sp. DT233]|uniref:DUF5825 family protein n=1 Tax=Micromonospora sp. DT233 TaxID=3393432 RepID=UPI003CF1BFE3